MQNIHPLFVHFPIALFTSSLILELVSRIFKRTELENVAKWNWWLGTLTSVFAVGSGWWASNTVAHSDASHELMELHETLGWVIFISAIIFSLWKLKAKPEWEEKAKTFTLLFQIVLVSILAYSSHLGGKLVYEFGIGTSFAVTSTAEKEVTEPQPHEHKGHSHKDSPLQRGVTEGRGVSGEGEISNYFCPMKCEGEKSYSKAGHCPVCGMNLIRKK